MLCSIGLRTHQAAAIRAYTPSPPILLFSLCVFEGFRRFLRLYEIFLDFLLDYLILQRYPFGGKLMSRLIALSILLLLSAGCFLNRGSPSASTDPQLSPIIILEESPKPKPAADTKLSEVPPWALPEILVDPIPQLEPEPKKTAMEEPLPLPPLPTLPVEEKPQVEEKTQAEEKPPADNLWTKPERKPSMYTFEILKTSGKQPYYWRVKASNGQIILTSEKYVNSPVKTMQKFTKRMQPGTFRVKDFTEK